MSKIDSYNGGGYEIPFKNGNFFNSTVCRYCIRRTQNIPKCFKLMKPFKFQPLLPMLTNNNVYIFILEKNVNKEM